MEKHISCSFCCVCVKYTLQRYRKENQDLKGIYMYYLVPLFLLMSSRQILAGSEWPSLMWFVGIYWALAFIIFSIICQLFALWLVLRKKKPLHRILLAGLCGSVLSLLSGFIGFLIISVQSDPMGFSIFSMIWFLASIFVDLACNGFCLWLLLKPIRSRELWFALLISQGARFSIYLVGTAIGILIQILNGTFCVG